MHYTTNTKVCFIRAYASLGTTWAETPLLYQNRIVTILLKRVFKQAVGAVEGKSEIATIPNKYKVTLDEQIDNIDIKSPDWPDSPNRLRLIDKRSCNLFRSRSGSLTFSEEDCLDEDVSVTSLEPVPKI